MVVLPHARDRSWPAWVRVASCVGIPVVAGIEIAFVLYYDLADPQRNLPLVYMPMVGTALMACLLRLALPWWERGWKMAWILAVAINGVTGFVCLYIWANTHGT